MDYDREKTSAFKDTGHRGNDMQGKIEPAGPDGGIYGIP
jgi:hypothetical protein